MFACLLGARITNPQIACEHDPKTEKEMQIQSKDSWKLETKRNWKIQRLCRPELSWTCLGPNLGPKSKNSATSQSVKTWLKPPPDVSRVPYEKEKRDWNRADGIKPCKQGPTRTVKFFQTTLPYLFHSPSYLPFLIFLDDFPYTQLGRTVAGRPVLSNVSWRAMQSWLAVEINRGKRHIKAYMQDYASGI